MEIQNTINTIIEFNKICEKVSPSSDDYFFVNHICLILAQNLIKDLGDTYAKGVAEIIIAATE